MVVTNKTLGYQRILIAFSLLSIILYSGCHKTDYVEPAPPNKESGDIYLAGKVRRNATDTTGVATYWKNGTPVSLTDGAVDSRLFDIVVSDGDIYAAGFEGNTLKYWKNGIATDFGNNLYGDRIAVSNGNFYMIGETLGQDRIDFVLKNGIVSTMNEYVQDKPGISNFVTCIVTAGTDIYMGGGYQTTLNKIFPMIWKNGKPMEITSTGGLISDITISGTDVYGCGTQGLSVTYWKNGKPVDISVQHFSEAHSIAVSGNDVYIGGFETNDSGRRIAKYWKNGVGVALSDGSTSLEVFDIAVSGNDVYVLTSGFLDVSSILWKNGKVVPPFDGTKDWYWATSIWIE